MEKLLRPKQVQDILGISEATLYRRMKAPDFPSKVRISKQAIGFYESEILDWMEAQKEQTETISA
jgi:prophage regulatory protein